MDRIENSKNVFRGQQFYIGIDVHKKQWTVSIRNNGLHLKTYSMDPSPIELSNHLKRTYPGGEYNSVYEAGYSGFWIHEELISRGIKNIIINPSSLNRGGRESQIKNDVVDSRKLAIDLERKNLQGIYIPGKINQELRSLCRLRYSLSKDQVRLKNRIKGHLSFYGKEIPETIGMKHWSKRFIEYLKTLEFTTEMGKEYLRICIDEMITIRHHMAEITMKIRKESPKEITELLLRSVPGIGPVTAITLYTELMDMGRFKRMEELASYVGLIPWTYSSGEKQRSYGLITGANKYLRMMLIEAAWIAVRKDPALLAHFNELTQKKSKSKAIISIAKQLLRRIRRIWIIKEEYVCSVVS